MSTETSTLPMNSPVRWNWLNRVGRSLVDQQLSQLRRGSLQLVDALGARSYGDRSDLQTTMRVHNPSLYRQAVLGGELAVAEAYFRGDWDCDDLTKLFRIFARNGASSARFNRGVAMLANWVHRTYHWWRDNSRIGSRRNIQAHYDLGNDFFRLWLDETMAYSSAVFLRSDASLQEASTEKFDRIARKMALCPTDQVLEIGTGWGGFALHAAGRYGCHVTTTTISQEQLQLANQRVAAADLADQISLLSLDYRDLSGAYDKLVSIEMIEAVGHRHLDSFFQKCSQLLRPSGSLLVQAIVMPERDHDDYLRSVDFIQRFVFPGGCLPSLGSMLHSVAKVTDLRLIHVEDLSPHYAETLRRWRQGFRAKADQIRALGYKEELIRLWDYYLCYCEAAFMENCVQVLQIQWEKPESHRDAVSVSRAAGLGSKELENDT